MSLEKMTYCTKCKDTVVISNAKYTRLANNRAIIEGFCSRCGDHLIKASIMPKSFTLKVGRK